MPPRDRLSVGWIVDSSPRRVLTFPWQNLSSVGLIRYGCVARHIDRNSERVACGLYRPWKRYDAVVFVKMMNDRCAALAERLKSRGVKVLFDANVNYYEDWGDFAIAGTRPSAEQRRRAERMTALADHVVADSTYLQDVIARINPQVTWIPDAVDTDVFRPGSGTRRDARLNVVWSGMGKKGRHLELIEGLLAGRREKLRLTLVTNADAPDNPRAEVIDRLAARGVADVVLYDYRGYAEQLRGADVIISPKILSNSYEEAHTEYKITLGMASGLAALASPQRSYREAVVQDENGRVCETEKEWGDALDLLCGDPDVRKRWGEAACRRVVERYSVPVLAARYEKLLLDVCGR